MHYVFSFNATVVLDANHEMAWFWKSWCENKLGYYEQAVERYLLIIILKHLNIIIIIMAISLNSTIKKFYYNKGLTLESLKRDKEALQRFYFLYFNHI